jgi:hypothetical protein
MRLDRAALNDVRRSRLQDRATIYHLLLDKDPAKAAAYLAEITAQDAEFTAMFFAWLANGSPRL